MGNGMRIAVDARQIFRTERRGIGKTLVPLYAALAAARPDWHFTLLHQVAAPAPELALPNIHAARLDTPGAHRYESWERFVLPAAAWACRADVLHAPANTAPGWSRVPLVLTIHDLIPVDQNPSDPATRVWLARVRRAAHAARLVMTCSRHTRDRLTAELGLDPTRIVVTPWATIPEMRPVTDAAERARVRTVYGIGPDEALVFGFGAADPRKNTARLIRAFAALPAQLRDSTRLLLVGIQPEALVEFSQLAWSRGVAKRVVLAGFAEEADLPALLSSATVVAFPSQNEGFGMPLLDALACGAAVLTGDRSSLPEVAGGAALLCNPMLDETVRDGLAQLLGDGNLRHDLATRGRLRAAEFDWARTAELVAETLERATQRRRP